MAFGRLRRNPVVALVAGKAQVEDRDRRRQQDRGRAPTDRSMLNRQEVGMTAAREDDPAADAEAGRADSSVGQTGAGVADAGFPDAKLLQLTTHQFTSERKAGSR